LPASDHRGERDLGRRAERVRRAQAKRSATSAWRRSSPASRRGFGRACASRPVAGGSAARRDRARPRHAGNEGSHPRRATSSLAKDDAERLFALVREAQSGRAARLYISHFLEEVLALADRFTVLRDGRTVGAGAIARRASTGSCGMMAGRDVARALRQRESEAGETLLVVEGLAGRERPRKPRSSPARGNSRHRGPPRRGPDGALARDLGLDPVKRGTVKVGAYTGPASPARRLAQGVGLLSEDRKAKGSRSRDRSPRTSRSRSSPRSSRHGKSARSRKGGSRASRSSAATKRRPVSDLSGGNQQKVALARLLHHDVDVLLLDEPTRASTSGARRRSTSS